MREDSGWQKTDDDPDFEDYRLTARDWILVAAPAVAATVPAVIFTGVSFISCLMLFLGAAASFFIWMEISMDERDSRIRRIALEEMRQLIQEGKLRILPDIWIITKRSPNRRLTTAARTKHKKTA